MNGLLDFQRKVLEGEIELPPLVQGGPGSGNFGHGGRPGKRGGSAPRSSAGGAKSTASKASGTKTGQDVEKWAASLSDEERNVVKYWGVQGFETIRREQVSGKLSDRTKLFEQTLDRDGSYEGIAYRGLTKLTTQQANEILSAKELKWDAHSSGSKEFTQGMSFAKPRTPDTHSVLFTIKSKTGVDISKVAKYEEEQEVVMKKGTKYKVVGPPRTETIKISGKSSYMHYVTLAEL